MKRAVAPAGRQGTRGRGRIQRARIPEGGSLAHVAATELFGQKINLVFYDCTTLYFESFEEDELRSKGFSKENRFNQTQVVLALAVTTQGIPLGYELFPGKMRIFGKGTFSGLFGRVAPKSGRGPRATPDCVTHPRVAARRVELLTDPFTPIECRISLGDSQAGARSSVG